MFFLGCNSLYILGMKLIVSGKHWKSFTLDKQLELCIALSISPRCNPLPKSLAIHWLMLDKVFIMFDFGVAQE